MTTPLEIDSTGTLSVTGRFGPASGAVAPSRQSFLPFSPPLIGPEEIEEVVDTLRSNWLSSGPKTRRFAVEFARHVGAPDALPLNSCTAGLHTALAVLGVGAGDEVITTPLTFAASVNVIEHVGARPVLVDVEPDTLNIDPERVAGAITPRTRAIIAVHYAGHPAELDRLRELARLHGVALVEDAAHAFPARYKGVAIGGGDNPTAFSFYATKNLTTGEGGMLTGGAEFIERARIVSLHGMSRDGWRRYEKGGSWRYDVLLPGFKYNMSDIQAALGLCQLRKIERFQQRRREIVRAYLDAFGELDALELPAERREVEHAWHLFVVRLRPEALQITRDEFIDQLTARNIGSSVHFIPIHVHPYYRDKYEYAPDAFPIAYHAFRRMVSLPLNPRMTDQDVTDVIETVRDLVRAYRR